MHANLARIDRQDLFLAMQQQCALRLYDTHCKYIGDHLRRSMILVNLLQRMEIIEDILRAFSSALFFSKPTCRSWEALKSWQQHQSAMDEKARTCVSRLGIYKMAFKTYGRDPSV